MMRSWESRADTIVSDEPFYAHYLHETGAEHPGAAEVMRVHETDWRAVVAGMTAPLPTGRRIHFQKHMAHHLLPHMRGSWECQLTHWFLIRDPREMLASLNKVLPRPTLPDTGLPQQLALFKDVEERLGRRPCVIDAKDLLGQPRVMLARLCDELGVDFDPAMLAWRPGRRPTDGVWGKYWYSNVQRSTCFEPYRPRQVNLAPGMLPLLEECAPIYNELHAHRLRGSSEASDASDV